MSMDAIDLSHIEANCDACDRRAFEPKVCGTCGRSSRYCAEHATQCKTCEEFYCDEHAPAHREVCSKINQVA